MVDFHSHALPGIDDGAADEKMSVAMLELSKKQGVDTVVLTPHYYASSESVDDFLKKREEAYNRVICCAKENSSDIPRLVKGAEVSFSYELLKSDDISRLCIENTNALLLEMPFSYWNSWIFDKLFEASASKNIRFIIAHAERYVKSVKDIKRLQPLFDMDYTIQLNSDSLAKRGKRRIAKRLFYENRVHLLGSDMHNNTTRRTSMDKAASYILRKYGEEMLSEISENEKSFFETGR